MTSEKLEMWREVASSLDILSRLANKEGWAALGMDLCLTALDIRCRLQWWEEDEANERQSDIG